jgi:hypothetical protein
MRKAALVKNESGYCLEIKVEENEGGGLEIIVQRCKQCSNSIDQHLVFFEDGSVMLFLDGNEILERWPYYRKIINLHTGESEQ